jgi:UDP-N-acetylmuramate dehydrogenase
VADLVDIEFEELARPVLHIGGGSNLLFTDDFKGTVLHSKINFIEILQNGHGSGVEKLNPSHSDEWAPPTHEAVGGHGFSNHPHDHNTVLVSVGAGVVFDDFCAWAAKEGLWGVENLSYIPGEVGASAVQNIGAYGVEVKDVIRKVYCYDTVEEEFVSFGVEECEYGYRDSVFKDPEVKGRYIVTHVVFALSRTPQPRLDYGHLKEAVASFVMEKPLTPAVIRKAIIKIRKEKLPEPSVMGSAGSFFKNPVITAEHFARIEAAAKAEHGPDYKVPHYVLETSIRHCEEQSDVAICHMVKVPAAWLIEQCGWKGKRSGGAAVYDKQPLVIVNYTGDAYPEEIIGLERRIIASVKAKFDIDLHPEVEHI